MKSTSMLFVIIPYSVRWCKLSCRKVRTEQVKFTLSQGQSAILAVYRQGVALGIAALNDGLGDQGLHAALDEPLDGTCAIDAVVSRIDDEVLGSGGDLQLEVLALVHALTQILQLQIHDLAHLVLGQALVVDDLVQTVQELRPERVRQLLIPHKGKQEDPRQLKIIFE